MELKFFGGTPVRWGFWKEFNYSFWDNMGTGIAFLIVIFIIIIPLNFMIGFETLSAQPVVGAEGIENVIVVLTLLFGIMTSFAMIFGLREWEGKTPRHYRLGLINSRGKRDYPW